MVRRVWAGGLSLAVLVLALIGFGAAFAGFWFLGDWLYSVNLWWLGVPVRILQWVIGAMIIGFTVYSIIMIARALITGKAMGD